MYKDTQTECCVPLAVEVAARTSQCCRDCSCTSTVDSSSDNGSTSTGNRGTKTITLVEALVNVDFDARSSGTFVSAVEVHRPSLCLLDFEAADSSADGVLPSLAFFSSGPKALLLCSVGAVLVAFLFLVLRFDTGDAGYGYCSRCRRNQAHLRDHGKHSIEESKYHAAVVRLLSAFNLHARFSGSQE